jgi:truncated hemoglobin YjbI
VVLPGSIDGVDLYHAIGGTATCRKLSAAFYARVARDSVLRPLFPGKTFKCAIEEFAAFLAQLLGGPYEDAQRRWWLSLRESHLRFKIGQRERDAWIRNMEKALNDVQIAEPVRSALLALFQRSSAYLVNTEEAPLIAPDHRELPGECIHQEITRRWDAQLALDKAVLAVRDGEIGRVAGLAETFPLQAYFNVNRSAFSNLLGLMIGSGHSAMRDYVQRRLFGDPSLAQERYGGRTLLHAASAAGDVTIVELLLRLGADPNAKDSGGHTPLYCVGNECTSSNSGTVVRVLVQGGANVNACDGVKHCTALHMAARRGNVAAAQALLDSGAEIEARDRVGDTPLRRSVNCGKTEVAELLLSRGADMHSKGSKGLTPFLAARAGAVSRLLRSRGQGGTSIPMK